MNNKYNKQITEKWEEIKNSYRDLRVACPEEKEKMSVLFQTSYRILADISSGGNPSYWAYIAKGWKGNKNNYSKEMHKLTLEASEDMEALVLQ